MAETQPIHQSDINHQDERDEISSSSLDPKQYEQAITTRLRASSKPRGPERTQF